MTSLSDLTTPTSVVIATSGHGGLIRGQARSYVVEAVHSIRTTSRHRELEFVIVHDRETSVATLTALLELPDLDVVFVPVTRMSRPAAALNIGALRASGQALVFLDERAQPKSDEAIGNLIGKLADPAVGMTGPKVVRDDGTIDQAGISIRDGRAERSWRGQPDSVETSPDLFVDRAVEGLDKTCVAIDAAMFRTVGGWSEEIPDRFRDLDLGLKTRREGAELKWSADTVLWRFAANGTPTEPPAWELQFMRRRWGRELTARPRGST